MRCISLLLLQLFVLMSVQMGGIWKHIARLASYLTGFLIAFATTFLHAISNGPERFSNSK